MPEDKMQKDPSSEKPLTQTIEAAVNAATVEAAAPLKEKKPGHGRLSHTAYEASEEIRLKIEGLKIYGVKDSSSPRIGRKGGVVVFTLKGIMAPSVAKELAIRGGIGVRYGCHCAHILVKHILHVPPALERFQRILARFFPRVRFPGVARVSLGIENTSGEIDTLIHVLNNIAMKTRLLNKKEVAIQINDFIKDVARRVYLQL